MKYRSPKCRRSESGSTLIEYAPMLGIFLVIILMALPSLGTGVSSMGGAQLEMSNCELLTFRSEPGTTRVEILCEIWNRVGPSTFVTRKNTGMFMDVLSAIDYVNEWNALH